MKIWGPALTEWLEESLEKDEEVINTPEEEEQPEQCQWPQWEELKRKILDTWTWVAQAEQMFLVSHLTSAQNGSVHGVDAQNQY